MIKRRRFSVHSGRPKNHRPCLAMPRSLPMKITPKCKSRIPHIAIKLRDRLHKFAVNWAMGDDGLEAAEDEFNGT